MAQHKNDVVFVASICAMCTAGVVLSFWPLSVMALVVAGLYAHRVLALSIGILLDILYGTPTGLLHEVVFPCTLLAVLVVLLNAVSKRVLLQRDTRGRV